MYYSATTMSLQFEAEKNRKAFIYTISIVGVLLLLAFLITWRLPEPPKQITEELIEVNLGNDMEGIGEEQPLVKGEMSPQASQPELQQQPQASKANDEAAADPTNPDEKDNEAAAVTKPVTHTPNAPILDKPVTPVKNPKPAVVMAPPVPKPQKPIATYQGPGNGKGNGADKDNDFRMQGNNPNGKGDAGSPNGNPDSYGNSPGGKVGGLRVSKGDRRIINNYIFTGELPKATINAQIRVSPAGVGTFMGLDKGSTSSDSRYVSAIRSYLPNIKFNASDHESVVTVPFNFRVQE